MRTCFDCLYQCEDIILNELKRWCLNDFAYVHKVVGIINVNDAIRVEIMQNETKSEPLRSLLLEELLVNTVVIVFDFEVLWKLKILHYFISY